MRSCRTCGIAKEPTEFWSQRGKKDGLQSECKSCMRLRNANWQKENGVTRMPQKVIQINDVRRKNPLQALLKNARERARNRGLEFSLRIEDLRVPSYCPILGIPMKSHMGLGRKGHHVDYSPSIDRIDNSRGYTSDNVVIVSYRANRLKSDASIDELRKIVDFYDEQRYLALRRGVGNSAAITEDGNGEGDLSKVLSSAEEKEGPVSIGNNR